ncbi:hypothetical protein [Clostridium sp. CMCC3677]|uniref:hypothetical protein n=1 Tax=Clostridium sp. CMCC3677 TaxID=2949963 RepID=UPI0013F0B09B|nr:hypothetical protein [Clostridium sp. CMCC3677]NFG61059.1 hypothetical protein [Clostridium botulinum]NFQ09356.1 hypothetical protein [Clostridium botulinum]
MKIQYILYENYRFIGDEDVEDVDAIIVNGWFNTVPDEPKENIYNYKIFHYTQIIDIIRCARGINISFIIV